MKDGIYETTDAEHRIEIKTDEETGETTYTFYRPDLPDKGYPLKLYGSGDEVTLKNVTIDGEGKWEIDQDKLDYDKELNKDYDVNVLDDP